MKSKSIWESIALYPEVKLTISFQVEFLKQNSKSKIQT